MEREYVVDMNCDMGESFGEYVLGHDEEVIRHITSANIACGFHASDPNVMEKTVRLCREHHVAAGAHPGYPDLQGFGRRFMDAGERELINYVVYQTGALKGFLDLYGLPLQHIKLHGALYNYMVNQEALFLRMAEEMKKAFGDVVFFVFGTSKTALWKETFKTRGLKLALEAFPDRQYTDDGELLSRKYREAVLHDGELIASRAVRMVKEHGIESLNGRWIEMNIDTICIHGDNPEGVDAAGIIRRRLTEEGVTVKPASNFL